MVEHLCERDRLFQRYPESLNPGNAVDLTDYYARHPGKGQDDLVTTAH